RGVGLARSCRLEPFEHRVDGRARDPGGNLDLQLPKAGGDPTAVEHRDLIVDHLGKLAAVFSAEHDSLAERSQTHLRAKLRRARERLYEVDRRRGRATDVASERVLAANE